MILKEIEMDLPYVQNMNRIKSLMNNQIDYEEAVKLDYEINWKQKRRDFQLMTRCMTSMIERLMPLVSTQDCWKIIIECTNDTTRTKCRNLLGAYVVPIIIEHDNEFFFKLDDLQKKEFTVNIVIEAIEIIASITDINVNGIRNACQKIKQTGYINEWMWKIPVRGQNGFAQIKIRQEVNETILFMVFLSLSMEVIKEVPIVVTSQDERIYNQFLNKLKWKDEKKAALITKNGNSILVDWDKGIVSEVE